MVSGSHEAQETAGEAMLKPYPLSYILTAGRKVKKKTSPPFLVLVLSTFISIQHLLAVFISFSRKSWSFIPIQILLISSLGMISKAISVLAPYFVRSFILPFIAPSKIRLQKVFMSLYFSLFSFMFIVSIAFSLVYRGT